MNFKDIKDEFVKPVGNQNVIKNQKKDDKCFIFQISIYISFFNLC